MNEAPTEVRRLQRRLAQVGGGLAAYVGVVGRVGQTERRSPRRGAEGSEWVIQDSNLEPMD